MEILQRMRLQVRGTPGAEPASVRAASGLPDNFEIGPTSRLADQTYNRYLDNAGNLRSDAPLECFREDFRSLATLTLEGRGFGNGIQQQEAIRVLEDLTRVYREHRTEIDQAASQNACGVSRGASSQLNTVLSGERSTSEATRTTQRASHTPPRPSTQTPQAHATHTTPKPNANTLIARAEVEATMAQATILHGNCELMSSATQTPYATWARTMDSNRQELVGMRTQLAEHLPAGDRHLRTLDNYIHRLDSQVQSRRRQETNSPT